MPTCFVIQGFGKKTDFESGRVLDLDASYEVIRDAVTGAGYDCVRADEIAHSRNIEAVMYEQLLAADLVIADLSTSNVNAFYELGVRFAIRPRSTIVVADKQLNFPFDINHIPIRTYEHLGTDIGRREADRFIAELQGLIKAIEADSTTPDSPVYFFLPSLVQSSQSQAAAVPPMPTAPAGRSLADVKREAMNAMQASRFEEAAGLWAEARELGLKDDYIVQQQTLATYKSKQPSEIEALKRARELLQFLWPAKSLDPETLGLWAAIHKRLYEAERDPSDLDEAITALEKGFVLARDYYNGINFAYLLDVRASGADPELAREDHGRAQGTRRQVVDIARADLAAQDEQSDQRYWLLATLEEAAVGLGDEAAAAEWHTQAASIAAYDWMLESTAEQIGKLRSMLADVHAKTGF